MTHPAAGPGLDEVGLADITSRVETDYRTIPQPDTTFRSRDAQLLLKEVRRLRAALREPPPQIEKALTDAWWIGRDSTVELPRNEATGPALKESCAKTIDHLKTIYTLSALRKPPEERNSNE